jgi:purine-nucleoside phosphorylase
MQSWTDAAVEAAHSVERRVSIRPTIGIILGTGLGAISKTLEGATVIETTSIPHFPPSTVDGHAGAVFIGRLSGRPAAVLSGRVHLYEGYDPADLGFGVRVLRELGCRTLIVTNAAGSLNADFRPGDVMVITDHISLPSLAGRGPLVGFQPSNDLKRFVDLTNAYDPEFQRLIDMTASALGQSIRRGVYVQVGGPNFETPAEVRFLRTIGGDAVGMSTVPEVIVARQVGMTVLGLSIISNAAAGIPGALLDHHDVMAAMAQAAPAVADLVKGFVARLPH